MTFEFRSSHGLAESAAFGDSISANKNLLVIIEPFKFQRVTGNENLERLIGKLIP